jgi:copper chaperone CopZ
MRQLLVAAVATVALAGFGLNQARADKIELKDTHLCCPMCIKAVGAVLEKVEGVSDAACDKDKKTVTFTAKDEKVAAKALKALADAGFYGAATKDGKDIKIDAAEVKKGTKADSVTVKDVHLCCNQCKKAVEGIFKAAKVSFEGKTVTVEGKGLDQADVIAALRKAGFNGTVGK